MVIGVIGVIGNWTFWRNVHAVVMTVTHINTPAIIQWFWKRKVHSVQSPWSYKNAIKDLDVVLDSMSYRYSRSCSSWMRRKETGENRREGVKGSFRCTAKSWMKLCSSLRGERSAWPRCKVLPQMDCSASAVLCSIYKGNAFERTRSPSCFTASCCRPASTCPGLRVQRRQEGGIEPELLFSDLSPSVPAQRFSSV